MVCCALRGNIWLPLSVELNVYVCPRSGDKEILVFTQKYYMSGAQVLVGSSFRDNSFYSTPRCLVKGILLLKLNVYIHSNKL